MRTLFVKTALGLTIMVVAGFGADPTLGTWKIDLGKSTYTPAPMPVKSLNVVREASGDGVKVTMTGELANGTAINGSYTVKYDGKEVPVTGNAPYDTVSIKQVNANTLSDNRKKTGGSYKATGRTVISNGGKTMTTTAKGTNTEGKPFASTFVFDKQ